MKRIFILALGLIGCSGSSSSKSDWAKIEVDLPDAITLYSLDGRDEEGKVARVKSDEFFHDYPVLGKVEITDQATRNELATVLKDAISRRPEAGAKCFWPRHGLRIGEKGKTRDYVICFECSWVHMYDGEQRTGWSPIVKDVQPKFDKVLEDAGVGLAPK